MMKADNKILIYFADYWDDMWRRRQQLAWRLAQTDQVKKVVYVERPLPITSFLKFLIGQADQDGMNRWRRMIGRRSWVIPVGAKLSVVTTFAPLPTLSFSGLFLASEKIRDQLLLHYLRKRFKFDCTIVWVSHPQLSVDVIQALEPSLLWYDCTEDFSAIPDLPDCVRAQIQTTDRWLTKHADVVSAVSRTLYEEKRQVNPNTHWLPNAADTEPFLHPLESFAVPHELRGIPHPLLAFVGGLNEWAHDWNLLDQVATLRPEWTFVLIGELNVSLETQQMLQSHPNVLCVGQKPYQDLPAYLIHSDICFQFYRRIRNNNTRNSQKLFLYFAAGKAVVSTRSADVESYGGLVEIVETVDGFVAGIERAIANDSPKASEIRRRFACRNSWHARVGRVRQILMCMGI